jgi:hypothetical protein
MVLEGTGTFDFERLYDAVAMASEANPGCRLIIKGALRSCYWLDSGVTPLLRRISDATWDGYSQDNAPFLNDRLPCDGPTCEVLWVEGPKQRLIFRSHHGAMDGRGCMIWAEDVFRALRGEELPGSRSNISKLDIMTGITDQTRKPRPVKCIAPTGKDRPGSPGVTWKRLSVTGKFHRLLGKVGWALAQSAWQYDEGPVRFLVPVDLRSRQPGVLSTGNLNAALYLDVTRESSPDSITQDILKQLENKNDCMRVEGENFYDMIPLKVIGIGLKMISRSSHTQGRYNLSGVISNLGRIDTTKFCSSGFRTDTVFFIPPKSDIIPAFITLTGCTGVEEICVSVPNGLGSENRFERLLQDIRLAVSPDAVR